MNIYEFMSIVLVLAMPIIWLIVVFIEDGAKVGLTITAFVLLFIGTLYFLGYKSEQLNQDTMHITQEIK